MISETFRLRLLAGAAALAFPAAASAQEAPAPAPTATQPATQAPAPDAAGDYEGDEEEIVITGTRARGSVVGDIPPEKTYDSRDVRATGATNISELLDALAPDVGSARGRGAGAPVVLLNGQRVSSFRELRDIPTEAISRVEILPEEVALKYGYRADQRVVNVVLRQRFRSTVVQVAGTAATEGGYLGGSGDVTRLMIGRDGRTQFNVHAEGNGLLTEDERNIRLDDATEGTPEAQAARSLIGSKRDVRGSATVNRTVFGNVSGTFNGELEHSSGRSLIGLGDTLIGPLARNTTSNTAHAGTTLNWDKQSWHYNVTGNADFARNVTRTDVDDPLFPNASARTATASGDLTGTANGKLFSLPAGDASTTVKLGLASTHLHAERLREGDRTSSSLGRTSEDASVNLDLPISRRNRDFRALGNLTLNANAEVEHLSDFGTLTTLGAGANWSPLDRLNLITSWTREEGPPTIDALGDPVLETPGTRVFDFARGETALVTAITGGNPDLQSDRRNVFKVGGNWQPFPNTDLRFRADYVRTTTDRPIGNLTISPAFEAAFPDRFVRAAPLPGETIGQLLSADLRPVNFDSARRDTLRVGIDYSKPLKSRRPSQSVMDQIRAQFAAARGGSAAARQPGAAAPAGQAAQGAAPPAQTAKGAPPPGPPPEGGPPPGADSGGGFGGHGGGGFGGHSGGRGGGGGFFGGGNRGRLQFSLTDTITLVDKVVIGPGLPVVDYLHGDAAGSSGGTPRHLVQAQAGYFNNGIGARVSANVRSGTRVKTLTGDDLRFSPLATFDLRLFANPGDIPEVALEHPWLRGTQLRLQVDNLFDSKPKVHDAAGSVPNNFQPDLFDPLGRTVMISFRKLFLPNFATMRRDFQRDRQGSTTP